LNSSKAVVRTTSARAKLFNLQITSSLGASKDTLKVTIDGIPVEAGKELELNVKPGLGGLELLTANQTATAAVAIDAVVDGRPMARRFRVPVAGGIRLKPSQVLSDSVLSISRIDHLFGPVVSSQVINATP
jgi:hypothetical protein